MVLKAAKVLFLMVLFWLSAVFITNLCLLLFRDRRVYKEGRLSYADFVWFLISEEDKKTDTRYLDRKTASKINRIYYIA